MPSSNPGGYRHKTSSSVDKVGVKTKSVPSVMIRQGSSEDRSTKLRDTEKTTREYVSVSRQPSTTQGGKSTSQTSVELVRKNSKDLLGGLPDASKFAKPSVPESAREPPAPPRKNSKERRGSASNQSQEKDVGNEQGKGKESSLPRKDSTAQFGVGNFQMPDTDVRSDRSHTDETYNFDVDATFGAGPPKTAFDETFGNAAPKGPVFVTKSSKNDSKEAPMAPNLGIKLSFTDMAKKQEQHTKLQEEKKQAEHAAFLEKRRKDIENKVQQER